MSVSQLLAQQRNTTGQTSNLKDNRPISITQRKLIDLINTSARVNQFKGINQTKFASIQMKDNPTSSYSIKNTPSVCYPVTQFTLKKSKVVAALNKIMELHGLGDLYQEWWSNGKVSTMCETIANEEATSEANVSSILRNHQDLRVLLRTYRLSMPVGVGVSGTVTGDENVENADVCNAYEKLVFFHGTKAGDAIRKDGLDPNWGGSDEGASATRSVGSEARTKNILGAKGNVFVSRELSEAKQYAKGGGEVVNLLVPVSLQQSLLLDADSQLGVKGPVLLKGAVNKDDSLNWWGMQYLCQQLDNKYTKAKLEIIWARVKNKCIKK